MKKLVLLILLSLSGISVYSQDYDIIDTDTKEIQVVPGHIISKKGSTVIKLMTLKKTVKDEYAIIVVSDGNTWSTVELERDEAIYAEMSWDVGRVTKIVFIGILENGIAIFEITNQV